MNRLALVVLGCISLAAIPGAFADAVTCNGFTSELTVGSLSSGNVTSDFGNVCVTLSGQIATITFDAASGYGFINTSMVDANINASSFTNAFVSESLDVASHDFSGFGGSKNISAFGIFNDTVDNHDAMVSESQVVFTVTNTSATLWTAAADVLAFNSKGFDAAAHVRCDSCSLPGQTGNTFFVAEGTAVPEPRSIALLLFGLLVVGGFILRRTRPLEN